MSELVHDIDFGSAGNSRDYLLDGVGSPEGVGGHSWSYGQQSRLGFVLSYPDEPHVLVMRVKPWLHQPEVSRQRIVLGIDKQPIATLDVTEDCVFALNFPAGQGKRVLHIDHLDAALSAQFDTYRNGQPMGLMLRWLRIFRHSPRPTVTSETRPPLTGEMGDSSLPRAIEATTGRSMAAIMARFESLGEWCHFGLLQRRFGADHPTLLRFAGLHVPDLVHGVVRRFDGIARPDRISVFRAPATPEFYDVHDPTYRVWWHTERLVHETTPAEIIDGESVRMPYLQRKFAKSLEAGKRIFVLTVPVPDHEAYAVFMALDLWARNTLLFVTQSGPHPPGTVERLAAGVLRGTIDQTDLPRRGTEKAWLNVLANAFVLADSQADQQAG